MNDAIADTTPRKSEVLKMAIRFCELAIEGPVKGGVTELDDVKRSTAAVVIGFVRQGRVERISAYNGDPPEETMRKGRAAAAEVHQWLGDPETSDEKIKNEVLHVTRMLEEEIYG